MNPKIEQIIVKFLMNIANIEELETLTNWLKKQENKQYFKKYVKVNYAMDINMNQFDTKNAKKEYLRKIKQDKSLFYKFRFYKVLKYAAAAVIVFGLGYFFKDNLFNSNLEHTPIVVDTNTIVPGTDKATLTLEDGSQVILEKGNSFQMQNANSDGEKIVYDDNKKPKEIVYNYLTIPRGGQFFVKLSDGTKVWLNSESQLKYPVAFMDGEIRQVELVYGEAYFDVSHKSSKFRVFNQSQEVEVLGTEFNIKAYKDESNIYTTLVEGTVTIDNGVSKQNLIPNQQSNLDIKTNNITVKKVDVNGMISWKNGVFSFIDMPLKDIMKVISRWYDVDIIFKNKELESIEFIGNINKRQSIEEILSIMKSHSINNYEIDNKTIILK